MHSRHGPFWRRPDDDPAPEQPLVVRSVGHQQFGAWTIENDQREHYHKIQWCVAGWAEIRMGGRVQRFDPGQIVHYAADSEHWARAGGDGWEVCWLTFTAGITDSILTAFGLERTGIYEAGDCPVNEFEALLQSASEIGQRAERRAGIQAYRILALAADSCHQHRRAPVLDEAIRLLQDHWPDPDFGIDALARRCGVHRSRLSRLFRSTIGIAPSRYLIRLRLQRAAQLLREDRLGSEIIAARCGFADGSYFARVFRKAYGMSPGSFRRHVGA